MPDARSRLISRLHSLLTPVEKARADRFYFASDRAAYVAAHGMLRMELGRRLGQAPEGVEIAYDALGKPRLVAPDAPPLYFSISHTRRCVACAFSRYSVGVDIEHVDREVDLQVSKVLSEQERRHLDSVAPQHRKVAFFEIWTMKEAALKAFGTGLSTPLDSFTVCASTLSIRPEAGSALPLSRYWCTSLHHLGNGFVCCAARISDKPPVPSIECSEWLHDDARMLR